MTLTDELMRLEAELMLKYIEYEWQGCKPHSRFARSLPLLLKDYLQKTKPDGVGQDANDALPNLSPMSEKARE